jgi:hypothetical protein
MSEINWGITQQPNAFQNAFSMGQQLGAQARENQQRNALLQYAAKPSIEGAAATGDPRLVMQQRRDEQEQVSQQRTQQRADMPLLTRLLDSATDEASYQRARAVAGQYGIDVSGIPPGYDPAWVSQQSATLKLLQTPQGQEALSTLGKQAVDMGFRPGTPEFSAQVSKLWQVESSKLLPTQPGGGVARYDPASGRTEMVIVPNSEGRPAGSPVSGAAPPPATLPPDFDFGAGGPAATPGTFR